MDNILFLITLITNHNRLYFTRCGFTTESVNTKLKTRRTDKNNKKGEEQMGTEFVDWFNEWAESYDSTVGGIDEQYQEVFSHYNLILEEVSKRAKGLTLEFGVGTGNLTKHLLTRKLKVIGIEPSPAMREKQG